MITTSNKFFFLPQNEYYQLHNLGPIWPWHIVVNPEPKLDELESKKFGFLFQILLKFSTFRWLCSPGRGDGQYHGNLVPLRNKNTQYKTKHKLRHLFHFEILSDKYCLFTF